ncbi:NADP-dependent oxidoreductase domain-containing protein [Sporodiniella umbellata]|nr:NADP-dependent oxidoreductase domain-containing protein [Sporodiniella umbellata]
MSKPVNQKKFEPFKVSFGAGALSGAYDTIEPKGPIEACRESLLSGINSFDTSPYYGKSEYILGDALLELRSEFPRDHYYLATKVGRYGYTVKDFDYSAKRVYQSVEESLKRLHTDYLDIVYCHDVEFVDFEQVVGPQQALEALFDLKAQGKIKYVGCSGYPLDVLIKIAEHQHAKGQPLDIVLSYCHYTLQNTLLADYAPRFRAAGVSFIMNASPLSMALLRDAGPPQWHPAHEEIRAAAREATRIATQYGLSISSLASEFAFQGCDRFQLDATVIGLARASEVQEAIAAWKNSKRLEQDSNKVQALEEIHRVFNPFKNYSWQSPSDKELGLK